MARGGRMDGDERELIRRCLGGDQEACASLVERYAAMIGTIVWRATGEKDAVEDLSQETFLRMFRGLGYFDGRAKLSTWICTIAHHVAIDYRRRKANGRGKEWEGNERTLAELETRERDPEQSALHAELDQLVRTQLALLPERYRLTLLYAAVDGMDYVTIGTMLGVKPGTVKTLIFRGRQLLRERMQIAMGADSRARAHVR